MRKPDEHQANLFDLIQLKTGEKKSEFVNQLEELLSISTDSAYRRLRGETPLTLSELMKLNQKYGFSYQELFVNSGNSISFNYACPAKDGFEYSAFLESTLQDFEKFAERGLNNFILFNAKDLPTFYFFLYDEISAFKGFFWERTFNKDSKQKDFSLDWLSEQDRLNGSEIVKRYLSIPSVEIWSDEILNSTVNQIKYAHEAALIDDGVLEMLMGKLMELIDLLEQLVKSGKKHLAGMSESIGESLEVYYNECMIGDNTLLLRNEHHQITTVPRNIMSTLVSSDQKLFEHTWQLNQNLIDQSILISRSGERERNKLFRKLRTKVSGLSSI